MTDEFKDDTWALEPTRKRAVDIANGELELRSSMREYLALPALSASILGAVLDECPYAGWYESWLNTERPKEEEAEETPAMKAKRRGSIAHEILLEGSESCCEEIDPNDYPAKTTGNIPDGFTNNAIRAARDEAKHRGKIPVLTKELARIREIVASGQEFIASLRTSEPAIWQAFQPDGGRSEVTMTWDDYGTPCKMRPDRISADSRLMIHLKTTARSAEPSAWGRTQLGGMGYYVSEAFYRRGARALGIENPVGVFLVLSVTAPYIHSLIGVDPIWQAGGDSEVERGMRLWQKCAAADHWPRFPSRCCYPEAPAYMVAQWEANQSDRDAQGIPYDISKIWSKEEKS